MMIFYRYKIEGRVKRKCALHIFNDEPAGVLSIDKAIFSFYIEIARGKKRHFITVNTNSKWY